MLTTSPYTTAAFTPLPATPTVLAGQIQTSFNEPALDLNGDHIADLIVQYTTTNPVTHTAITPTLFHSTAQGFSTPSGQALPSLNLTRVFVLTSAETCSASEAIMNGLRGVNVQVIQIGSTTCGKPYGFYPPDNCGTTYFSIQFRGVNDQGFGDYTDGFSPNNTAGTTFGYKIPGCSVADDFNHALGDPNEGRLSQALAYRAGGSCTVPPSGLAGPSLKEQIRPELAIRARAPIREISILRDYPPAGFPRRSPSPQRAPDDRYWRPCAK